MKYKYYAEIESEKHYMYASEVAEWLKQNYGVVTETGKAHVKMVQALLEEYDNAVASENGVKNTKFFYNTRRGLKRVYISTPKIVMNVEKLFLENDKLIISAGGRNYKYKIMEKEHE